MPSLRGDGEGEPASACHDPGLHQAAQRALRFLTDWHADNQRDVIEALRLALKPATPDTPVEKQERCPECDLPADHPHPTVGDPSGLSTENCPNPFHPPVVKEGQEDEGATLEQVAVYAEAQRDDHTLNPFKTHTKEYAQTEGARWAFAHMADYLRDLAQGNEVEPASPSPVVKEEGEPDALRQAALRTVGWMESVGYDSPANIEPGKCYAELIAALEARND